MKSMVPPHYKSGLQISTFLRLREQSSSIPILLDSIALNAIEMFSLGYDWSFLYKCLCHLALKSKFWAIITYLVLRTSNDSTPLNNHNKLLHLMEKIISKTIPLQHK